jgi:hypothetical protein
MPEDRIGVRWSQWGDEYRATFTLDGETQRATWHGGAYIDISNNRGTYEIWNVWDYAAGRSTLARTRQAFMRYVRDKLSSEEEVRALRECRAGLFYPHYETKG